MGSSLERCRQPSGQTPGILARCCLEDEPLASPHWPPRASSLRSSTAHREFHQAAKGSIPSHRSHLRLHQGNATAVNEDTLRINDIITRWKGRQSIRAMARELGISRTKIAGIISQHQEATQSTDSSLPPTSLGKAPLVRASKLDPYRE